MRCSIRSKSTDCVELSEFLITDTSVGHYGILPKMYSSLSNKGETLQKRKWPLCIIWFRACRMLNWSWPWYLGPLAMSIGQSSSSLSSSNSSKHTHDEQLTRDLSPANHSQTDNIAGPSHSPSFVSQRSSRSSSASRKGKERAIDDPGQHRDHAKPTNSLVKVVADGEEHDQLSQGEDGSEESEDEEDEPWVTE